MSILTRARDVLDRLATAEPINAYDAVDLVARDDIASPGDLAILLLDLDDAIRAEDYGARALPTTPPPDVP